MTCRPRRKEEGIFAGGMGLDIAYQGVLIAVLTLAAYYIGHYVEARSWIGFESSRDGMTMAFLTMSMAEIFHSYNGRSERGSIFALKSHNVFLLGAMIFSLIMTAAVIYVPFLSTAFGFASISFGEYCIAIGLALLVIPVVEIVKVFQRLATNRSSK